MQTIFVVDDNDVNLITAEKALEGFYTVFTLPSAEAMFEFLDSIVPDLILLDIRMPKISGLDALNMLKASKYIDIPVIVLTGKHDPDTEAAVYKLGAVDFVLKPFVAEDLLARIKAALA
ncbi:MAG: response regulator [Defluviitaleaceae bacterium]|nr:response regulator [Defluviitaleaceae bacterium]